VTPDTLKIAFIGTGGVLTHYMPPLRKVAGVEVVAAADLGEWGLSRARDEFLIPHTFTDYRQMLREVPAIQAVCVCTPNKLHAEHTIAALEAGKHVLVEKPMAMNAGEARRMVDAARRAGKQLIVGFQHRFEPRSKYLRDQIASGGFGKILYVKAQALRRRGIPSWGQFGRKDLQGGGPLMDIGVHVLETAHYLIGSPRPLAASGSTFTCLGNQPCNAQAEWGPWDHSTYTVEDLAVGQVRFDGGAVLSIETSFAAHVERDVWNIQIVGERAGADWATSQIFTDQCGYMVNTKAAYVGDWPYFEYKVRHFVEVCRDGRPNEVPGEHGLMVQKMLDALYASAEQGREVAIE
jgi:predicted dehydrogenase